MSRVVVFSADTDAASLLQTHFSSRRYQTHIFSDFLDINRVFDYYNPDILVFDLDLNPRSLVAFLQNLYAHESWGYVPRIFLQGFLSETQFANLEAQGHGPVLKKPLESASFHAWLSHYLAMLPTKPDSLLASSSIAPSHGHAASLSTPDASYPAQKAVTGSLSPVPAPAQNTSPSYSSVEDNQEVSREHLFKAFLGRVIGSVEIQSELGQGGMGAVFTGRQTALNRKVAVKIMLPELVGNTMAIERFRREALAIARLKSPHIVQVFDAGTTPDQVFYIVMEFLEGSTITQHIKSYGRYPIPLALNIASQVAQGLQVAHQAGLIHRDIKPSNLMIDNNLHVTITDFGLVRSFDMDTGEDQLTQAQSLLGTPVYLSPEQATGQVADARSDIYSLGIVLFRMLVGQPPFLSDNMFQLLMMHHSTPLPDPRSYVPEIPKSVADILFKMTAKHPEDRYPHCTALLRDLHIVLAECDPSFQHPALLPTGTFPPFANRAALPPTMMGMPLDSSVSTPSPYGSSGGGLMLSSDGSLSSSAVPAGDILPEEFVEQLQLELARYIGPIAKIALKEEAKRLGYSRKAFPLAKGTDWISLLASRVDPAKRPAFQDAANRLLHLHKK